MSNSPIDSERNDGDEIDPGQPIKELAGFEHNVSATLLGRIRRAIGRRTTAAQVTTFAFDLPFVVFKEFWLIVMDIFSTKKT